jgi:hypothetical protein
MAKWGEIKCPRCAEADDLVQAAVAAALERRRHPLYRSGTVVPGLLTAIEELEATTGKGVAGRAWSDCRCLQTLANKEP